VTPVIVSREPNPGPAHPRACPLTLVIKGPGPWADHQGIGKPFFSNKAVGLGPAVAKTAASRNGRLSFGGGKGAEIDLPVEET
jgi:hypothetical protein